MKQINTDDMIVIQQGLQWKHQISPCSRQAIQLLEKNTKIVTWLKPKDGDVKDQIPCILYKNKYFSLSLRMQKAIYRHIRLKKGFQNEETIDGMKKLKIPDVLLREKMRTQSRFDAMRKQQQTQSKQEHLPTKKTPSSIEKRERHKTINTIASKMKCVVEKMIENGRTGNLHHQVTIFIYKSHQSEIIHSFFQEIQKENPMILEDKNALIALISSKYDEIISSLNHESMYCPSNKTIYFSRYLVA